MSDLRQLLRRHGAQHPTRVADRDHPRRNIPGDHGSRPYHAVVPYGDTRADDGAAPYPDVVADAHRLAELDPRHPRRHRHRMGGGVDLHPGCQQHVVTYVHLAHIEDGAVDVGVEVLPHEDVGAIVAEEWRVDGAQIASAAEQIMEQGIPLRLLLPVGVEAVIEAAAALACRLQLGVARIIALVIGLFITHSMGLWGAQPQAQTSAQSTGADALDSADDGTNSNCNCSNHSKT